MHPYIPRLLADIAAAHRPKTNKPDEAPTAQTFEEEMEEIENWMAGEEAPHTFGYWCGLEASQFPPPEQLSNKDMVTVCKAFDRMMYSWNLSIDLPKKLPNRLKYSFRVDTLNKKTAIVNSGFAGFDYCTGYALDCVFKQYCPCLKIWNSPVKDYSKRSHESPNETPKNKPDDKRFYDPDDPLNDLPF